MEEPQETIVEASTSADKAEKARPVIKNGANSAAVNGFFRPFRSWGRFIADVVGRFSMASAPETVADTSLESASTNPPGETMPPPITHWAKIRKAIALLHRLSPFIVCLLFIIVVGGVTCSHEMWRDEIQAWLIARDSRMVWDIITNTRYEGHPWLWHLILWLPAKITWNPAAMQVVHVAIATAAVFVVMKWAPFPWLVRLLLVFGYFLSYEWAVVSRNYAVSALLLFSFAALYQRRWRNSPAIGGTLFLLCLTNIHSLILTIVLAPLLMVDYAVAYAGGYRGANQVLGRSIAAAMAIFAGIIIGVVSVKPPADSGFATQWHLSWSDSKFASTVDTFFRSYAPLPLEQANFWNTCRFIDRGKVGEGGEWRWRIPERRRAALALAVLAVGALLMFKRPWPVVAYIAGTLGVMLFFYVKYMGSARHHGFLFIWFIVALWMSRSINPWRLPWRRPEAILNWVDRAAPWLLSPLLLLHVWGAAVAWRTDRSEVFSQGKAAAAWLREEFPDKDGILWVGHPAPQTSTVLGHLQLPGMFRPGTRQYESFVAWDKNWNWRGRIPDLVDMVAEFRGDSPKNVVFVMGSPMPKNVVDRRGIKFLKSFQGSVSGESFHIYKWSEETDD